jgi:hypothetical protein
MIVKCKSLDGKEKPPANVMLCAFLHVHGTREVAGFHLAQ